MDEVLSARATRSAVVERFFDELSDGELERVCRAKPSPEYPDEPYLVGRCVRTVLREELEHRRYAERDISTLRTLNSGFPSMDVESRTPTWAASRQRPLHNCKIRFPMGGLNR